MPGVHERDKARQGVPAVGCRDMARIGGFYRYLLLTSNWDKPKWSHSVTDRLLRHIIIAAYEAPLKLRWYTEQAMVPRLWPACHYITYNYFPQSVGSAACSERMAAVA